MNQIIFHIDVNSAFLSWEAVYRLAHKGGRLDLPVDAIRGRLGADAVMRAAFLGQLIAHMSGGVSREKRSADR